MLHARHHGHLGKPKCVNRQMPRRLHFTCSGQAWLYKFKIFFNNLGWLCTPVHRAYNMTIQFLNISLFNDINYTQLCEMVKPCFIKKNIFIFKSFFFGLYLTWLLSIDHIIQIILLYWNTKTLKVTYLVRLFHAIHFL